MGISRGMRWYGREVSAKLRAAAADGLLEAAEELRKDSQAEAPVQEGTMILSAEASVDRRALKAAVSYDTPYAPKQHEDRSLQHRNGRKAKFLEDPAERNAGRYLGHVSDRIRAAHG